MPYFEIVHAGLTRADNKVLTIKPRNIDAQPARGEAIKYEGKLYRIVDIIHHWDANCTELLVFEDIRQLNAGTLREQIYK